MSTSITRYTCPSPFANSSNLRIPSTTYTHTTYIEVALASEQPESRVGLEIIIELRIEGWYKLYIEPIRGCPPVTLDETYIESPKFTYRFKVPLFLYSDPSSFPMVSFCRDSYIAEELSKLPISLSLAEYLKPHVVDDCLSLVQMQMHSLGFKLAFEIKIVKIDLASHQECDAYRSNGFI
ncbi:hypothetical protein VNO77_42576 [Canavalia gladiata]|uniref:Uncharacterized protein n=1 Tax=Canavalia gladiata TaxID=3824 RepID=A0AAN9JSK1_CANGL